MDIYCPKCGEPWTMDSIHTEVDRRNDGSKYSDVRNDFVKNGCSALDATCSRINPSSATAAMAAQAMYEIMPDDMDGCAAMFEDMFGLLT